MKSPTRRRYENSPKRKAYLEKYRNRPGYKEKMRKYRNKWEKKKYKEDIKYRINCVISTGVRTGIKEKKNGRKWETLVGYNVNELIEHLENQFEDWMSWENYGEWEIDHIKPKSSFNFTSPEDKEFKECWTLENLQPLEKKENIRKRDKVL